uniref:Uncharacterized protein n=1 Tax=Anguilla anguilla TaxID=7936 RepID=A0A0E9V374_ANGAN
MAGLVRVMVVKRLHCGTLMRITV